MIARSRWAAFAACVLVSFPAGLAFAQAPDEAFDPQRVFEQAMAAREEGELEEAIRAFQSILRNQPGLNRARLELAVAYFRALNYAQARAELERVLADPDTPENVKVNVRRYLQRVIALTPKKHQWTPYVSAGLMYDSNVTAGPDSDTFQVGDTTITLGPGAVSRSDLAAVVNAGITHRYTSPRSLRVGDTYALALWQSQASLYEAAYQSEHDFDLGIATLVSGPALVAAGRWRANVNLEMDRIYLGRDWLADYYSLNPSFVWVLPRWRTEIAFDGRLERRNFQRAHDTGRDSGYQAFGMSVGHLFAGERWSVQAGLTLFRENADQERYSNDGQELFAGVYWRGGARTNAYARASRRDVDFDAAEPAFTRARDEFENRFVLGATHLLSDGVLRGWTLRGTLSRTERNSNIEAFEYERTQALLALERSFN